MCCKHDMISVPPITIHTVVIVPAQYYKISYEGEIEKYLQVCSLQSPCSQKSPCQNLKQLLMQKVQSVNKIGNEGNYFRKLKSYKLFGTMNYIQWHDIKNLLPLNNLIPHKCPLQACQQSYYLPFDLTPAVHQNCKKKPVVSIWLIFSCIKVVKR